MWSPCYFYQDWYLTSSFAISCKFEWMLFLFCLFAVCFPLRTTIIKFYLLWICNIFLFSILRNSNIFLTSQHFFFVYWCRSLLEHWCRNNVPFWAWRGFCLRRWWWGNFFFTLTPCLYLSCRLTVFSKHLISMSYELYVLLFWLHTTYGLIALLF